MASNNPLFSELEAGNPPRPALEALLDALRFDSQGLIPVIAQQHDTGEVLMLAWMNRAALNETLASGQAVYFSRSRGALWRKGETSGNTQTVRGLRFDCDGDALLLEVDQQGPACHTGRQSCFYVGVEGREVVVTAPVLRDPKEMYRK